MVCNADTIAKTKHWMHICDQNMKHLECYVLNDRLMIYHPMIPFENFHAELFETNGELSTIMHVEAYVNNNMHDLIFDKYWHNIMTDIKSIRIALSIH